MSSSLILGRIFFDDAVLHHCILLIHHYSRKLMFTPSQGTFSTAPELLLSTDIEIPLLALCCNNKIILF